MEDDKPKPQVWNYDSELTNRSPELQTKQSVDWSSVGEGMTKDVSESHTTRWYFNGPGILAILLISVFVSHILGVILVLVFMSRIIIATVRSNRSPSKAGAIIGWIIITILLVALALFL